MAEYIDREEFRLAMQHIYNDPTCPMHIAAEIEQIIDCVPAADVAPVVHGRWVRHTMIPGFADCSVCKDAYVDEEWLIDGKWGYCPNCGARMDGEAK